MSIIDSIYLVEISMDRTKYNENMYLALEQIMHLYKNMEEDHELTEFEERDIDNYIDSIAGTEGEVEKIQKIAMIKFINEVFPNNTHNDKIKSILKDRLIHPSVTEIQAPNVNLPFITNLLKSISKGTLVPKPTEHELAQIFNAILNRKDLINDEIYELLYELVFSEKGMINKDDINYLTPIQNQLLNQLLKQFPTPQLHQFIKNYTLNSSEMALFF